MPPLDGPRAMLWVTRKPWNTPVDPSSIDTGIETSTDFLHPESTRIRFGSSAKISPTRRSCALASSNGFSRRWDSASAVDMELRLLARLDGGEYMPVSPGLADAILDRLGLPASPVSGPGDDANDVRPGPQPLTAPPS